MARIFRTSLALALLAAWSVRAEAALEVHAWARASIAGVDNVAVYGKFTNAGNKAVAITSVRSPIAAHAMIHETVVKNGMVSMKPIASLPVPAGKTVVCKPGKCHFMLMGLKHPLTQGSVFTLTLGLDDGASVDAKVKVGGIAQMTAPDSTMRHE